MNKETQLESSILKPFKLCIRTLMSTSSEIFFNAIIFIEKPNATVLRLRMKFVSSFKMSLRD